MLSFDEAVLRVVALAPRLGSERLGIAACDGRVLADDVLGVALPAFDHSAMDGYAIRRDDVPDGSAWELPIEGESAAGSAPRAHVAGTACRIFTGAPLPLGADTVIMQEDVTRGDGARPVVRSTFQPKRGAWVRRRGDDLADGAVAIARGTRLGPGSLALAAALDRAELAVGRSPVVTVLASGDELRAPGEPARPGSIVESNGLFVGAVARRLGAVARLGPFVRDDRETAARAIADALAGSDVVVTVGGVSVGDHDVIRPALEDAGVALEFHRVAMKPGKPLTVGRRGSTVVLGLPGNPASASLTFLLFGVPLLRAMQGERAVLPTRTRVRVQGTIERAPGRTEFLRARLAPGSDARAVLARNQASGAVTSFADADVLVIVPAATTLVRYGDELEALRIADLGA